jgi:hypothetical protein
MRPARLIGWVILVTAAAVIRGTLPASDPWRQASPLALAAVGLLVELAVLLRQAWMRPARKDSVPSDARPADGEVGLASLAGVESEPNATDHHIRRFIALKPMTEPRDDQGLASNEIPALLGRVVLISVFLGRDGRSWSDDEIAQAHAALRRAGVWIEREAIRWNAPVNVELAETYFVADDHVPEDVEIAFFPKGQTVQPFEAHAVTKALSGASRAARLLGFADAVALFAAINPRVTADARVWLLHPLQAGHSMAVPHDESELTGVSLAVCYAREANFPEPLRGPPFTDPVTIVHELLHLFGAIDKYAVSLRAFPPRTVSHRDIMRLDVQSLSRSRIDALTAREIGWLP